MARVRGRGNKSTEQRLARLFRQSGIKGWRRHLPLPGTPDFAFPTERLAIFVDGCFWHGCPKHATFPATRRKFWLKKFADNKARDRRLHKPARPSVQSQARSTLALRGSGAVRFAELAGVFPD